jgi:DNA-binding IclR family transcriptional regulator
MAGLPAQQQAQRAGLRLRAKALQVERAGPAAKRNFSVNEGILYPGLTTVAAPLRRPSDRQPFVIFCAELSAALPLSRIHREIGPRMAAIAQRLTFASE